MNTPTRDVPRNPASFQPVSARSKVILPVEDERIIARDLQLRLHKLGYSVPSVASSKAEAMALLEQVHPDLVLMDIQLNGIAEGIEAAQEVRQRFDLPVIYLTAHSDTDSLEQAKLTEPFGYILKPFEDRELLAAIEMAVYKHDIERRLRETERRLRQQADMIGHSHDAVITTDPNRVITGWNAGAAEIYGWTEKEALGQVVPNFLKTKPPVPIAEMQQALERDGRWDGEIVHTAREGKLISVESRQILVRGENGKLAGVLEIDRDITDRKRAQAALEKSLGDLHSALTEKTVLLREIHHRVKNNLAVISSLLSMKADATDDRLAQLALEQSQQRVRSIALIHEQLYGTDRLDRILFGEYAQQLASELETASGARSRGISITVAAEPVQLEVSQAVPCALILNELVTNALKHGFPDNRGGEVRISFCKAAAGNYELAVSDNGAGLTAASEERASKSLGMRIINILARQLDGSIEREPGSGARFVLRFPAKSD
ncbi:MAG: response regulator [Acidobacteriia bacterium]|nr:response regulator [Terriglobia bacterium]